MPIETSHIEQILGHKGNVRGGVFQVNVPRAKAPKHGNMEITNSMDISTVLTFQPTGEGRAATTGDFVLEANEVNPVIRALHENGIDITALHSHMLDEQPRLFLMHFWANDDLVRLAKGLRAALNKTGSTKQ
ncbi:MAG TPA: DUF1259 domain-containing protein [Terriglobales bacterium]|nr:DUF1259 domain-containing protein [Terriglobales bacterium]